MKSTMAANLLLYPQPRPAVGVFEVAPRIAIGPRQCTLLLVRELGLWVASAGRFQSPRHIPGNCDPDRGLRYRPAIADHRVYRMIRKPVLKAIAFWPPPAILSARWALSWPSTSRHVRWQDPSGGFREWQPLASQLLAVPADFRHTTSILPDTGLPLIWWKQCFFLGSTTTPQLVPPEGCHLLERSWRQPSAGYGR